MRRSVFLIMDFEKYQGNSGKVAASDKGQGALNTAGVEVSLNHNHKRGNQNGRMEGLNLPHQFQSTLHLRCESTPTLLLPSVSLKLGK